MENRSAIWIFTSLLILACIYQLSFNYVVNNFEKKAEGECVTWDDKIHSSETDCVRKYLNEHNSDTIYPVLNKTYAQCKEQQLNLGLDLQGGMSAALEVDVPELINNFKW